MIENFFNYAKAHNCSDIHIAAGSTPMVRIDGDIMAIPNCPIFTVKEIQQILDSIMTEKQKEKFEENLDLDFALYSQGGIRFRANAFFTINGPAVSFRRIASEIKTIDELNIPAVTKNLSSYNKGLILLVGAAGTGKTTTIAAMLDEINSNYARHIITIEDPVEFVHKTKKSLISQREVGINTLSFANALRSALREDPDVIMIGEMRDVETIRFALTAAETGHLIFATLHTNSASQTINRIIDIFPGEDKLLARAMLSTSLRAVISQKLLKKKTGGRCAAYEVLVTTPAIRNLIREDQIPQIDSMISLGRKDGMCSMKDSIAMLLEQGVISAEVAEGSMRGI
jgi:twitching motility protein PilT